MVIRVDADYCYDNIWYWKKGDFVIIHRPCSDTAEKYTKLDLENIINNIKLDDFYSERALAVFENAYQFLIDMEEFETELRNFDWAWLNGNTSNVDVIADKQHDLAIKATKLGAYAIELYEKYRKENNNRYFALDVETGKLISV